MMKELLRKGARVLTKGYRGYRGRMSIWEKLLIVLLCLLLLSSIGFLLLKDRILDLAEEKETVTEQKKPEPLADGELEIIIEEPRKPEKAFLCAVELDQSVLRGGTESALAALKESGANAFALRLKGPDGQLHYSSSIPEAQEAGVIVGNSVSDGAISDLISADYHSIARITALHDSAFAYRYSTDAAVLQLQYPGVVWYDPDSTFWLAPEKELTQSYLSRIAMECAALGFDEVLFDEFAYPSNGRQSNIDERGRTLSRAEAVETLAAAVFEALGDTQTLLSIELDAKTVLAGGDESKGQIVERLALCFDRIYVKTTATELPKLEKVFEALDVEFIPILREERETGAFLLAQ